MSNTQDEQFLPLDSSIKTDSIPQYSNSLDYHSNSIYTQESQINILSNKISELEKNYVTMEKKYLKKIKQLKLELVEKHQLQATLNLQLSTLAKQYQQHKSQIQKISSQIKKSFQQIHNHQQKQTKLKSTSPKNHTNNSPKRLIKKSLQIAKKQIPNKKQLVKDISASHQINISSNTQRSDKKLLATAQLTHDQKKALIIEEANLKNSQENSLNSSNQTKNGRKIQYSPPSLTNGPSPKKKLLFNSSKQLDLFSKQIPSKRPVLLVNGSPSRKINISPTHKKKQNIIQNKILSQKQILIDLPVIQQKPIKYDVKINQSNKLNNSGPQPSSPAHRKKQQSPQNVGLLKKKISNKNLTIQTNFTESMKQSKSDQKQQSTKLQTKQKAQKQVERKQIKINQNTQKQKQSNKSPAQSTKNIKISPQSKFSPTRKLLRNSPTHKKSQSAVGIRPKLFTNMRQKFDQNIFK